MDRLFFSFARPRRARVWLLSFKNQIINQYGADTDRHHPAPWARPAGWAKLAPMTTSSEPPIPDRRPRVFLSYARADRERVANIVTGLDAAGFEVWWDALIEGGSTFAKTIAAALAAADVVVVVWSKASVESDWVLDEAMYGRDHHRLIPVAIDAVASPLGFRQYQVIDLSGWRGQPGAPAWLGTLRAIGTIAATAGKPVPESSRPAPRTAANKRRRVLLAGSGVALATLAGGGYLAWQRWRPAASAANSVAVLPFRNMSGDATQVFFSDGLSEELRIALSRNPRLRVAAQTSSNVFRERQESAQAIAARLEVAYLLDGSVRRADDTVRIGVSLIDAGTGFNRWSQVFERSMKDIFAVQAEIAQTVATTLAAQIATPLANPGGTASVVAFDAYLRGRALYQQDAGEQGDRGALRLFDAAIAADPEYASAYAARANSLVSIAGQYATADDLPGLYDAAEAAARRAIALAPELAAAHSALALVLFGARMKVREARESYELTVRLGGGDANILSAFSFYCAMTGRADAALAAITRALSLDPLNAVAFRMHGWVLYRARRYSESIAPMEHALSLNMKIVNAHASIGDALFQLGRVAEARSAYLLEPSEPFRLAGLAVAERALGNAAAAQAANGRLVTQLGDSSLYQQAQVLANWGERDSAIAHLLRARTVGDQGLIYSHTDPLLDSLRGDARFRKLQSELGFD
jgi:TolB-like protein/tetratricopeptide (TPR) repeat protein